MTLDLAALRAGYASDPAFPAVFAVLAAGRNVRSTSVRLLAQGGALRQNPIGGAQVQHVFDQLATWGFGTWIARERRRARLLWRVRPKAVLALAEGRLAEPRPGDFIAPPRAAASPAPPAPAGPPPLPPEWHRHRVALEPGREVELAFPPDLAPDEAKWLGDYLERMARKAARQTKTGTAP